MAIRVTRVQSSCGESRRYLLENLIKGLHGRWIIFCDKKFFTRGHGKNVAVCSEKFKGNAASFDYIWLEQWPGFVGNEELLFELFSRERKAIFFSQSHEYPFDQDFFKKWDIVSETLWQERLHRCFYCPWKNALVNYGNVYGMEKVVLADLRLFPHKFFQVHDESEMIFYDSRGHWSTALYCWLLGRQSKVSLLSFSHENKVRRYFNSQDALPRQTLNWGAVTALGAKDVSAFLWRSRWWQKTKEYCTRARSFNFFGVNTFTFNGWTTKS